jgi:tRNA pseudouridine38-40 synthase
MPTLRLDLAYDGSGFRGYARQDGLTTIQGRLESALETVLGAPLETAVAGRTDAGVHARGQVASVEVETSVDTDRLARSLNGMVGPEIAVMRITEVDRGFHARFSARWRRYRYSMATGPAPDPLTRGFEWHVGPRLDQAAMGVAATHMVGERDFSAFCRSADGAGNVRLVEEARWEPEGDRLHFWIRANAFCHQMVRSVVGLCYDVGRGFTPAESVPGIIESKDRSRVATVAPPHGLTLWEVGY